MSQVAIIYARSTNYCIGDNGGLPWSLPNEYQHFERCVSDHPVIMGRRSFEDHDALIPNCTNIVVSRQKSLHLPTEVILAGSLEEALAHSMELSNCSFVIGGAGLITEALPLAHVVFETIIDADIDGDTFLDPFDFSDWSSETLLKQSPDDTHEFAFQAFKRSRPDTH